MQIFLVIIENELKYRDSKSSQSCGLTVTCRTELLIKKANINMSIFSFERENNLCLTLPMSSSLNCFDCEPLGIFHIDSLIRIKTSVLPCRLSYRIAAGNETPFKRWVCR